MGKHIHRLSDKDFGKMTATCAECGPVLIQTIGNSYQCRNAYLEYRKKMRDSRRAHPMPEKGDTCAKCGFKGEPCQIDQDHRNGDRTDHRPENVWDLCANCHRLKSFRPHLFWA